MTAVTWDELLIFIWIDSAWGEMGRMNHTAVSDVCKKVILNDWWFNLFPKKFSEAGVERKKVGRDDEVVLVKAVW